jgi:hypothetical protein
MLKQNPSDRILQTSNRITRSVTRMMLCIIYGFRITRFQSNHPHHRIIIQSRATDCCYWFLYTLLLFNVDRVIQSHDERAQFKELTSLERLGKKICDHFLGRAILNCHQSFLNTIRNKEVLDVDMPGVLSAGMLSIFSQ